MAQFDFAKIRTVEDLLSGYDFGYVTIEWQMVDDGAGGEKRVFRIQSSLVPAGDRIFYDTVGATMDDYIAEVRSIFADRKAACDASAAALAEAEAILLAQFPVGP